MDLRTENDRLRWLVEEQRLQIRDLEMDITFGLDRQETRGAPVRLTTVQVRAYADSLGVSERTVYRQLERGEITPAVILGKEA